MEVIENFALLTAEEQRAFAETLIKTINSESTFTTHTHFEIADIEVDDFTGGLIIQLSHTDLLPATREATWICLHEDDAYSDPGYDAEYQTTLSEEVKKLFKTFEADIDGYYVDLQLDDVEALETSLVEVSGLSYEDDGIGSYEYFGFTGYDSQPYIEVEGSITNECECEFSLHVEAITESTDSAEPEEN